MNFVIWRSVVLMMELLEWKICVHAQWFGVCGGILLVYIYIRV